MNRSPKFHDSINNLKLTEYEYVQAGIGKEETSLNLSINLEGI
jgi:hypothetical protein